MKKLLISTKVTIHGVETPITFADSLDGRDGSIAKEQILGCKTINAKSEGTQTIVPYHSIIKAEFTKTESEFTKPDDDFCNTSGGDVVGTAIVGKSKVGSN